jgi:hypothetical protein
MSGIGSFLNNLGNSGIGSGLPQGGSGAGGFLDSLFGGFQQAHQAAQQQQMQRASFADYQRQSANQQISQNVTIAKSNPALLQDPKFIQHMKQLSQQAGLPNPSQMTPGTPAVAGTSASPGGPSIPPVAATPGTPAGMPTESLNMQVLAPGQEATSIDPKLKDDILSTPAGPQREAKMAGLANVPESWHTVHAIATDVDKRAMYTQLKDVAAKFGAGKMSGTGAAAAIQPFVEQAIAMGMDPNAIAAQYTADAAAGPEVAASIAKMQALGYKDKEIGAFEHMKTVEEPERFAEAVRVAAQNANAKTETADAATTTAGARVTSAGADVTRAATGQQNANTNAFRAQTGAEAAFINARAHATSADAAMASAQNKSDSSAVVRLHSVASALQADNNNVTAQVRTLIAAGGDPTAPGPTDPNTGQPGPSLADQQLSLQGKLKQVTDQMFQTTQTVQQQPTNNLRAATGNPSVQLGDAPQATTDQRGRYQITPQGILDTSSGIFTPRNANPDPSATQHTDTHKAASGVPPAPLKPVITAKHQDNVTPPKDLPSGLVADFKRWTPAQRLEFLQSPRVSSEWKAYVKTLIPPPKAAPAAPQPQAPTAPRPDPLNLGTGGSQGNGPFSLAGS